MDGGGRRRLPAEPEREREPDEAVDGEGSGMPESEPPGTAAAPAAEAGSGPPAHWLADIRARAPHLLEPGGLLSGSVSASEAPATWPHGPEAVPPATYDERHGPARVEPAYPVIEPRAAAGRDVGPSFDGRAVPAPEPTFEPPEARPPEPPAYPRPPTTPAPPTHWPDAAGATTRIDEVFTTPPAKAPDEPGFPDPVARPARSAPDNPSLPPAARPWEAWPRFSVAERPAQDGDGPVWGTGRSPQLVPARFPALNPDRMDDEPAWGIPAGRSDAGEPRYTVHDRPWASLLEPDVDEPPDWRVVERRLARRSRLDREQRGR